MKIAVFVFSKNGYKLNMDLKPLFLQNATNEYHCYVKTKQLRLDEMQADQMTYLNENDSMQDCVKSAFLSSDALIFICSTGIAVRMIAPFVADKSSDPAVLVIDDMGHHCISLLSGHLGGANELCQEVASFIGATPVITTASDLHDRVALDMFAKKNQLAIANLKLAKDMTSVLLSGETIGLSFDALLEKDLGMDLSKYENMLLPDGYCRIEGSFDGAKKGHLPMKDKETPANIVYITQKTAVDAGKHLQLVPQNVRIGIGCRKDTTAEKIAHAIQESINKHQLHPLAIKGLHSIDLKKDEPGILYFCEKNKLSFTTFSKEELQTLQGDFSSSEFVSEIVGVDCVCERAAVALGGTLFIKKEVYDGVTIAMSIED